MSEMRSIKIALDWTPNGNHVGMFVAKAKGMFAQAGLDVAFISPHLDAYKTTPASRIESGEALLAVAPSESVISHHLRPSTMPKPALKAVAALLQQDDSSIVTLKSSGIDRPAKLDGKKYASYGARFEGRIVQQMIRNDGGSGDYVEIADPMLDLWQAVLGGQCDATWIFNSWEGVEAKLKNIELNLFQLGDYGIPYGYSPVLLAHPDALEDPERAAMLRAFLKATSEGYAWAAKNPKEASRLMEALVASEFLDLPTSLDKGVLDASIASVADLTLDGKGQWGTMQFDRWNGFLDWLAENGLLTTKVQSRGPVSEETTSLDGLRGGDVGEQVPREAIDGRDLFTNDFLPY